MKRKSEKVQIQVNWAADMKNKQGGDDTNTTKCVNNQEEKYHILKTCETVLNASSFKIVINF